MAVSVTLGLRRTRRSFPFHPLVQSGFLRAQSAHTLQRSSCQKSNPTRRGGSEGIMMKPPTPPALSKMSKESLPREDNMQSKEKKNNSMHRPILSEGRNTSLPRISNTELGESLHIDPSSNTSAMSLLTPPQVGKSPTPGMTSNKNKTYNMRHVGIESIDKSLLRENYYHGLVNKQEVESALEHEGDFLVGILEDDTHSPPTSRTAKVQAVIVIALKFRRKARYFVIGKTKTGRFHIAKKMFDTIPALIQHYVSSRESLHEKFPVVLKHSVHLPDYIITHDRIKLGKMVGKGAFGRVYIASLVCRHSEKIRVAVKTFKGKQSDSKQRQAFMKEARIMRGYKHINIVDFIGIATQQEPLMLVLEFCGKGSLLNYLRKNAGAIDNFTLYRFSYEGASGLSYLEEQKVIHRDVAARNCLLTRDLVVKVSDFGLSVKTDQLNERNDERLPIKYLAPEVIKKKEFSHKSDVWAYGVMLHEIYTHGEEPYKGMNTKDVKLKMFTVPNFRMKINEELVNAHIATILDKCWAMEPEKRPTFKEIQKMLDELPTSMKERRTAERIRKGLVTEATNEENSAKEEFEKAKPAKTKEEDITKTKEEKEANSEPNDDVLSVYCFRNNMTPDFIAMVKEKEQASGGEQEMKEVSEFKEVKDENGKRDLKESEAKAVKEKKDPKEKDNK